MKLNQMQPNLFGVVKNPINKSEYPNQIIFTSHVLKCRPQKSGSLNASLLRAHSSLLHLIFLSLGEIIDMYYNIREKLVSDYLRRVKYTSS